MRRHLRSPLASMLLLLPLAAAACASDDAEQLESPDETGADAGTESDDALPDLPSPMTADPIALDRAAIEAIAGSWSGPVDPSPAGRIPLIPLDFEWESEALLHAHTDFPGTDGYFDFRFEQTPDGRWRFTEEGKLPGGLIQTYTLDPVAQEGDTTRWVWLDDPELLTVELTVTDEVLVLDSWVRGVHHATFDLAR